MKQFILACIVGFALGCSDDGGSTPDAGLKSYGDPCTDDTECDSKLCANKFCSKVCNAQTDCPIVRDKPFDCGEVKDGKVGCYPRTYAVGTGAMGHDCSLDGKCNAGLRCMGEDGAADRYCSSKCTTDLDCPPQHWCSLAAVGQDAEKEKWCRKRQFCHPCVIDDQCGGPEDLCVKDVNGEGHCSKTCNKTGSSCPTYAKCEDAGNNKLQCRHKAGACFKGEGGLCDPCVIHGSTTLAASGGSCTADTDCPSYPKQYCATVSSTKKMCLPVSFTISEQGGCKSGSHCLLLDRYTGESGCIDPCGAGETCPSDKYACATIKSLQAKFCVPVDDQGYIGSCHP